MWTLLAAATLSWAVSDKASYPPQKFSARGVSQIEITGVRGRLKLIGRKSGNFRLHVKHSRRRSEDWNLQVERQGGVLVFEVSNAVLGREWRKQIREEQWPEFDIELEGPALPAKVSWRVGTLEYLRWNADTDTTLFSGDLGVRGGKGALRVQTVRGRLNINGFTGNLNLRGQTGAVELLDVKGVLNLSWLHGSLRADRVAGRVRIEGRTLNVQVHGSGGQWHMKLLSGTADVRNFVGAFKGEGQSTRWNVVKGRNSDFEVLNKSGPVDVYWQSPAKVFLTSFTGDIASPYRLEVKDGIRVAQGKNASRPAGQVFVRTDSGDIHFKH